MATGQANAEILRDKCPTLNCAAEQPIYCGKEILCSEEKTFTLSTVDNMRICKMENNKTVVRRLTPVECERLQGFPDNYTNIPWKGKPSSPDGRRYKALGNSMAVPVMRWIGRRIEAAGPIERDERAIERALYVTPGDDEQLTLF